MSSHRGPRLLGRLLRRLLPGPLGAEACDELDREYREAEAGRGALRAWLGYARHLFTRSTWSLAHALHRRRGVARPKATAEGVSLLDVKLGLRMLVKHPGLTFVSGLAISISIALGVGTFSFVKDYLVPPELPLPGGDRVVSLGLRNVATNRTERRLLHDFWAWRDELTSYEALGAYRMTARNVVSPDGSVEEVTVAEMTASGFRVAGVPPLLGRPLLDDDEIPGAAPVAVIGLDVWRDRFGEDPAVVGRTVELGGTSHTVVGVMPEGFTFPVAERIWIPLRWRPTEYEPFTQPDRAFAFGLLAEGVSRTEAQAELRATSERRAADFPETHEDIRAFVMGYTDTHTGMDDVGNERYLGVAVILGFVILVLSVPFVNVAVLVYARTATRSGEIAIRNALGASRRRVVVQLFVEALVLAGLAGAVGVGLALFALARIRDMMAMDLGGAPFWARYGQDTPTVLFALGLTVLAAVIAGVIPGLQATGRGVQSNLSRLAAGNGLRLGRTWNGLIVTQVALTVAAVPSAIALAWGAVGESVVVPGFDAAGLWGAEVRYTPGGAAALRRGDDAYTLGMAEPDRVRELAERMREAAGVEATSYAAYPPGIGGGRMIEIEGLQAPVTRAGHLVTLTGVADDYFEVLGVPAVSGRTVDALDRGQGVTPLVVDRSFARVLLADQNPVGRRVRYVYGGEVDPGPWHEIVGMVEDLTENPYLGGVAKATRGYAVAESVRPRMYAPLPPDERLTRGHLVVRAAGDPGALAGRLRTVALGVDPTLRLDRVAPLTELDTMLREGMRWMAAGIVLAVASVLFLATAGIYALVSFNVTQRRREIGVRSALGAQPARVMVGVLSRAARQLGLGAAAGLALAWLLSDTLFARSDMPIRPSAAVLLGVVLLVVLAGMTAAWGPARRGLRIEPTEALRGIE